MSALANPQPENGFLALLTRRHGQCELSEEMATRILELRAQGKTLEAIAAEVGVWGVTILAWRRRFPGFDEAYLDADTFHAEHLVDQMQVVCDQALAGEVENRAVGAVLNNMTWRASVMHRKRYGEKQEVALTGGLALQINTEWRAPEPPAVQHNAAADSAQVIDVATTADGDSSD